MIAVGKPCLLNKEDISDILECFHCGKDEEIEASFEKGRVEEGELLQYFLSF